MKIERNKVVSVTYELNVNDEAGSKQLVEKVEAEQPMVFLFGASGLPEKFEQELEGMNEGENFQFSLSSDEAYGEYEQEAVVELPHDIFKVDGNFDATKFPVGTFVPMTDPEGNMLRGRVLEIRPETLVMDFNHPLAGHDLFFVGNVLNVREATPEEAEHGHVHGPGGHHH